MDRLTSLVSDVVEISIVEGDPALQGAASVSIADILGELVQDCGVEAGIRGCRLQVEGRIDGPVLGNRELLRRAVENVVRNAIRYAPAKTAIASRSQRASTMG